MSDILDSGALPVSGRSAASCVASLVLEKKTADFLRDQALDEAPRLACAYLAGSDGRVSLVLPLRNLASEPETFAFDPGQERGALRFAASEEMETLAFYHSRLSGPARPRQEELRLCADGAPLRLIYSLYTGDFRAFILGSQQYLKEIPVRIAD